MRIGFFTDGFPPGADGVSVSSYETAKELERRGHEVFIVAPKYPGYVEKNPRVTRIASVMIHRHPEIRMGVNLTDAGLRKTILNDFDIIHGHSGGFITFMGREVAREKKIPFVFTYHTLWNRYTHYFMKGKVLKPKNMEQASKMFGNIVDCIIAPTQRVEKELRRYGVKKPIVVIPTGIPTEKFAEAPKGFLRTRINHEKGPILLYVGRLGAEKSVDFIIQSFRRVLAKVPDSHLVLVGDGVDRRKLEALTRKLKVDESTHFLGSVPIEEMKKVYKDASVFVFASTSETQGLVVPEALSSGVPVVAVDDPAYDCITNGEDGYLVKKDEAEFAEKVAEILLDVVLQKKLSDKALENSKKLSIVNSVDKLEGVYFDLLDKYNVESVPRIMGDNERAEKIYSANIIFWITIVILRLWALFSYSSQAYPAVSLGGYTFLYPEVGIFFLLIFAAAFLHQRKLSFLPIAAAGVGAALVSDGALALVLPHATTQDYWNILNLIPIVLVGVISGRFTRTATGERPKFYINTRQQKHINPDNPKVSVVIPAYNEGEFIEPTLKSLINQTYENFEIIVVDNNSSDNTAEVARRYGARVVKQKIKGVAAARDMGFRAAAGEIILSTDADSIVPANWVEKVAAAYTSEKVVGFAGLNELYSGAVSARAAGRYLFPIFWWIDKELSGGWNMAGFNMSVRKSAFLKIGGFDTTLKMGEDIDLSQKIRKVGEIRINPKLVVYSSGRRYSKGLMSGMMSYAPWWISKVLLHQNKPFEFADVRAEEHDTSKYSFIPISVLIVLLGVVFWIANLKR